MLNPPAAPSPNAFGGPPAQSNLNVQDQNFDNQTFQSALMFHSTVLGCGFKKTIFKDCKFSRVRFERCYFRLAEFRNVQFTSCTFVDCNFDDATFADVRV